MGAVALYNVHLANALNQITPESALETPQLSGLKAAAPLETAKALTKLLETMNARFNFAAHKKLNEIQIGFLVGSILTEYWRWKIDEVAYVLRQGIAGKLKSFDHLDEAVVLGWFREHEATREALIERAAYNENLRHKETAKQPIQQMGPVYAKQYAATLEPEHLPAYEQWLREKHPDRPELAQAVADYQHEVDEKVRLETIHLEEQRAKARALIGEYDAANYPAPDLESEATKYFAAARPIPKASDVLPPPPMQVVRDTDAA